MNRVLDREMVKVAIEKHSTYSPIYDKDLGNGFYVDQEGLLIELGLDE